MFDFFWWAVMVATLGLLGIATLVAFGFWIHRRWLFRASPDLEMWLRDLLHHGPSPGRGADLVQALAEEYLNRRNEFWTTYGQFVLSMLVIVFITILLLAKVISPEAGLPILAGVGGFAIGKGTSGTKGTTFRGGGPQG